MTDYTKLTDFASKDTLVTGNAAKIVKGTELDDEFEAIETAVATKANINSPTFTGTPTLPTGTVATTQSQSDNSTKLATTAYVDTAISNVDLASIYPVGSIYMNATSSTNPATLIGFGTWVAFGAGRVPVGIDSTDTDFDTAEETGGAKTHTLTVDEMPAHTHSVPNSGSQNNSFDSGTTVGNDVTGTSGSTGGGSAHNNLQPYIVVYMWKRTA
jgi:hypothetical protein